MNKVLFVASIDKHILAFHLPYLKWFKDRGFTIDVASKGLEKIDYCDHKYNIPFERSPYSIGNYNAYKYLKEIVDSNCYDLIHCHTPMASVLTRIASIDARKKDTKVLYTAHGFHFYNGAPKINWLLYYPVEWALSGFTDALITINAEDYSRVKKRFRSKNNYLIPGIGIREDRFHIVDESKKRKIREKLGIKENDFVLLYVAEFIPRKNHKFIIDCVTLIKDQIANICVLFAGQGILMDEMKSIVRKYGLNDKVKFLGWVNNIGEYIAITDVGVSSSYSEGLGLGLAEEMNYGIPVIATKERGHKELIDHGVNGFMYDIDNKDQFVGFVNELYADVEKRVTFGRNAKENVKKFNISNSLKCMQEIYEEWI
jgi:glycosyltransferase EpsD